MTPRRLREVAALLIEDARLRQDSVERADREIKTTGAFNGALVDSQKLQTVLQRLSKEATERTKAAHELQEYSFGLKGVL